MISEVRRVFAKEKKKHPIDVGTKSFVSFICNQNGGWWIRFRKTNETPSAFSAVARSGLTNENAF